MEEALKEDYGRVLDGNALKYIQVLNSEGNYFWLKSYTKYNPIVLSKSLWDSTLIASSENVRERSREYEKGEMD